LLSAATKLQRLALCAFIVDAIRRNFLTHADNTENESVVDDWLIMVPGRITTQEKEKNERNQLQSNK